MRWLLRLYPRAWRDRYEDEFAVLLEERPLSLPIVVDVLRGAVDAQLHTPRDPLSARMVWASVIAFGAVEVVLLTAHRAFRASFDASSTLELAYQLAFWGTFLFYLTWLSRQPAARCDVGALMRRLRRR